jgi:hypothetical protein
VAFALQELMRIYDVRLDADEKSSSSANSSGMKIWKRFTLDVQEILMPLTQSR